MKGFWMKVLAVTSVFGVVMSLTSATAMAHPAGGQLSKVQINRDLQRGLQVLAKQEKQYAKGHPALGKVVAHEFSVKMEDGSVLRLNNQTVTVPSSDAAYVETSNKNLSYSPLVSNVSASLTTGESVTTYAEAEVSLTFSGSVAAFDEYGTFDYKYNTPNSFTHALHTQTSTWEGSIGWTTNGFHPGHGTVNSSTAYVDDSTLATLTAAGTTIYSTTEYLEVECDYYGVCAPYAEPASATGTMISQNTVQA